MDSDAAEVKLADAASRGTGDDRPEAGRPIGGKVSNRAGKPAGTVWINRGKEPPRGWRVGRGDGERRGNGQDIL